MVKCSILVSPSSSKTKRDRVVISRLFLYRSFPTPRGFNDYQVVVSGVVVGKRCAASDTKPLEEFSLEPGISVSDTSILGFGFPKTTPNTILLMILL